jgi:hypothetical protein
MIKLNKRVAATLLIAGFTVSSIAFGAKKDKKADAKATADAAAAAQAQEAMKKAMQLGAPSAAHQVLSPLIGKWTCVTRGWMKPGDTPQESQGTSENTWAMGNRFLKQEFKGTWGNQPFEGVGFVGYDNVREQYQSIWLDNFMTGIMENTGTFDAATNTLKTSGTFGCPMTGEKDRWSRAEWKIVDNDNNVYTSYAKGPDGNEFKSMEIVFKRAQ